MKLASLFVAGLFALAAVAMLAIGSPVAAYAQEVLPGLTIAPQASAIINAPSALPEALLPWWNLLLSPPVLLVLASHARAWFPWLGNLGPLTMIGDFIVGNYLHAKNAK